MNLLNFSVFHLQMTTRVMTTRRIYWKERFIVSYGSSIGLSFHKKSLIENQLLEPKKTLESLQLLGQDVVIY